MVALCSVRGGIALVTAPQPEREQQLLATNVVEAEPLHFYERGKRSVASCVRLAMEVP